MVHLRRLQRLFLLLPALGAACATGWQGARARVDELAARIAHVEQESAAARTGSAQALAGLQALLQPQERGEQVVAAYARFVQSIDEAERRAEAFRAAAAPMQQAATLVFERWEQDLAAITGEELRRRGQARLQQGRERFAAIVAGHGAAEAALATFHRTLRDHAQFLAHDLNPASLRELGAEVARAVQALQQADAHLVVCSTAAHAYVTATAPHDGDAAEAPAGTPAAPPATPPRGK